MGERLQFDDRTSQEVIKEISQQIHEKLALFASNSENKNLEQAQLLVNTIIVGLADNMQKFLGEKQRQYVQSSPEWNKITQSLENINRGLSQAEWGNTNLLITAVMNVLGAYFPEEVAVSPQEAAHMALFTAALEWIESQSAALSSFKERLEALKIEVAKHEYTQDNKITSRAGETPEIVKDHTETLQNTERKSRKALKEMFEKQEAAAKSSGADLFSDGSVSDLKTVESADKELSTIDLMWLGRVLATKELPANETEAIANFWNDAAVKKLYANKPNADRVNIKWAELSALKQLTQLLAVVQEKTGKPQQLTAAEWYVQAVLAAARQWSGMERRTYKTALADQLRLQQMAEVHTADAKNLSGLVAVFLNNDVDNLIEAPSKDTDLSSLKAIRAYQRNKLNPVGVGSLMEWQKVKIFQTVRQQMIDTHNMTPETADAKLSQHIAQILAMWNGATVSEKTLLADVNSADKLYAYFQAYPAGLTRLRQHIEKQPEYLASIFEHGKNYLSYELERVQDSRATWQQHAENMIREMLPEFDSLDESLKNELKEKINASLMSQRISIDAQVAQVEAKIGEAKNKSERENLLMMKQNLLNLKTTMWGDEYITSVARTARSLGVANVDDLLSTWVGVSKTLKLERSWIARNIVDTINFTGWVLQGLNGPDGGLLDMDIIGTNLALGISFWKSWELGQKKDRTVFYQIGVGWGLKLQWLTAGWSPYALVWTSYEKNGITGFSWVNVSPLGAGISIGAKVDVMKRFDAKSERIKTDLTKELGSIIKACNWDYSYENVLAVLTKTYAKNRKAMKHVAEYAGILSDILKQTEQDATLKSNLSTVAWKELLASLIAGAFMEQYNTNIEKMNALQITWWAVGIQVLFTPWGLWVLPTWAVFVSIMKKSVYTPDAKSVERQGNFRERLAGIQDTGFTFADIDEVNVLLRTQERDDNSKEIIDLYSTAKLELRGKDKEFVFVPDEFLQDFNLEIGNTVPYMRIPSAEVSAEATDLGIDQANLTKAGVLIPSKAKPVVVREFFGNHEVRTLAIVSQESDKRQRILPWTADAAGSMEKLKTYNAWFVQIETYMNEKEYIKSLKAGMSSFNTAATASGKWGRALFQESRDPVRDVAAAVVKLPLLSGHGMDLSKLEQQYSWQVKLEGASGNEYLIIPNNFSVQFVQARDNNNKSPITYLLVKEVMPEARVPKLALSLQMMETFDDDIQTGFSEIVSPNPDGALVEFLSSSDAADMFIRWRYEYKNWRDMHQAYYDAIESKNYSAAMRIAQEYVTEAISKADWEQKTKLQGLNDSIAWSLEWHTSPGTASDTEIADSKRTIANLHYLHASLSRVTMTEKKHLNAESAGLDLDNLIGQLSTQKYSEATRNKLKEIGTKILNEPWAFDADMFDENNDVIPVRSRLEKTLSVSYDPKGRAATEWRYIHGGKNAPLKIDPEYKIAFLLVKMEQVARIRTEAYRGRIVTEPWYKSNPAAVAEIMNIREDAMSRIPNKPLANGDAAQKENVIGLVVWYGGSGWQNLHVDEKFVYHPRVITGTEVVIDNEAYPHADIHKKYYLDNLQQKNPEALDAIAQQIIDKLQENWFWDSVRFLMNKDYSYNYENLKDMLISWGTVNGGKIPGLESLTASFKYCFFPECINEMIILDELKMSFEQKKERTITPSEETPVIVEFTQQPVSRSLWYVNYTASNRASREQRDLPAVGIVRGNTPRPKAIETPPSETEATLADTRDFDTIDFDNVVYKGDIEFTVWWVTYVDRPWFTLPNGITYAKDLDGNRYKITPAWVGVSVEQLTVWAVNHLNGVVGNKIQILEGQKNKKSSKKYLTDTPEKEALK